MGIRGLRSGALASALVLTAVVGLLAAPAEADDAGPYPSWDEVEAARGNQAETESTVSRIDALLTALQAEAARLGDAAVARTAESDAARAALARATTAAESLTARADAAADSAAQATDRAGQIAAALYRSGGADLTATLILSGDGDLLGRLSSLDRVGGTLQEAMDRARTETNQAAALAAQASAAREAREAASVTAQDAAAAAVAAADAADAAVATQQANLTLLFDQLAALRNTTAALEQQYRAGQQATNDPGDGGGVPTEGDGEGDDGGDIVVPGGEVNDVAAARAYAFGQLAARGLGADEQSCLLSLWNRESGWRTNAYNAGSGAYGIPQSLPGSKMAVMGADWRTNYVTQVNWGLAYIDSRYGTPCGAWAHSEDVGWY